jgi:G6PDH family F420-dependent oxidoreductase
MTEIGYFLSSEEHDGTTLLETAVAAEATGFRSVWISDHYHPWIDRQGQSPFVWTVIGAIAARTDLRVATAVTCPTYRIHPAVVAQAAATSAAMMPGRFSLGVGSGENLNEHVLGQHWPMAEERQDRLQEAIEIMRALWEGGVVDWHGEHYTVEGARLYTLPDEPIPVLISAFGPKAMDLVVAHGDGWITTRPDTELMPRFRQKGSGRAAAGVKVCWGPDEAAARRLAHELWPTNGLKGELSQELKMPAHFEQATALVTEEQIGESIACGPDPERHMAKIKPYLDAGFDELYIQQIGPDQAGFMEFYEKELRDRLAA